jgi:dsRNA-specific ribonuclease
MALTLGYRFRNEALLTRALTHSSYSKPCNEQLEFLGDSVLSLVTAESMFRLFPDSAEGVLASEKANRVNNKRLAELAIKLRLGYHLILGRSEECSNGRTKPSILADALEALIGAIYLDGGIEAARDFIIKLYKL